MTPALVYILKSSKSRENIRTGLNYVNLSNTKSIPNTNPNLDCNSKHGRIKKEKDYSRISTFCVYTIRPRPYRKLVACRNV